MLKVILFIAAYIALMWVCLLHCRKGLEDLETLREFRYAHRGLHDAAKGIPENSLLAFRRAVEHGFGAELDVHLTKDGRLAVIHDTSLLRTAGADVKVCDLTVEELKQYRLEGTDEQIPLLEEVLPIFEGEKPLIVELKVDKNAKALAKATCEMLDKYNVAYCIESFHPRPLRWVKRYRPNVCRGLLSQNFLKGQGTGLGKAADFIMTHLLALVLIAPDFVAYKHEDRDRLNLKIARKVWGVQEVSWTVRSQEAMEQLEADNCLIIFENFIPD